MGWKPQVLGRLLRALGLLRGDAGGDGLGQVAPGVDLLHGLDKMRLPAANRLNLLRYDRFLDWTRGPSTFNPQPLQTPGSASRRLPFRSRPDRSGRAPFSPPPAASPPASASRGIWCSAESSRAASPINYQLSTLNSAYPVVTLVCCGAQSK